MLDLEVEDISDFIRENKISMHILQTHENPYRPKQNQGDAAHWSCKIINNITYKHIVVYFSKGIGIRQWREPPQTESLPLHVPRDKIQTRYDGPQPPFENDKDQQTFYLCSELEPPSLPEVLDVLAKDIWLIEQTGTFERWTATLKSTPDSLYARAIYDLVNQQLQELKFLLGEGMFHKLIYEIDRIHPFQFDTEDDIEINS